MNAPLIMVPLSCLLALAGPGCGGLRLAEDLPSQGEGWIMGGGSPARTSTALPELRPPLDVAWEYDALAGITAAPLVRDSVVILANLRGEIHAVHLGTGIPLGRKTVTGPIAGSPVLHEHTVIAGGGSGPDAPVAYDLVNGKIAWTGKAGPIAASLLLTGDRLVVAALGGAVVCLDPERGDSLWSVQVTASETGDQVRSSPAEDAGIVVVGSNAGIVFGLQLSDGAERWRRDLGSSVLASPVLGGGRVVIGSMEGKLFCLSLLTGEVLWQYDAGAAIYGPAALAEGLAVVGASDGGLHAVEPSSGKLLWRFTATSVFNAAPLISGGIVYAGSLDRTLYAVDGLTGEEVWRFEAPGRLKVAPVQIGTTLLLVSEDRSVLALRRASP